MADTNEHPGSPVIAVCADPPQEHELLKAAARLAVDLNLHFLEKPPQVPGKRPQRQAAAPPAAPEPEMLLAVTPNRLELRVLRGDKDLVGGRALSVDLTQLDVTSPAGRSLSQPIAKALGLGKKGSGGRGQGAGKNQSAGAAFHGTPARVTIIDATAGWGEDAWVMAALGGHVLAVERNKTVATLLRDGLLRAGVATLLRDGLLRAGVATPALLSRVSVVTTDARHLLRRIARINQGNADPASGEDAPPDVPPDVPPEMKGFLRPDVVYLDPMFGGTSGGGARKSAERKPMRVLRRLVGDDADAGELFEWAMRVARKRVVVKRPIKGDRLGPADLKPDAVHKGKGFRYDVYVPKGRG